MTAARYNSYCAVVHTLDHLSLAPHECEILRDAAEGFLLCRDDDAWVLAELGLSASIVLDRAVSSLRVTRAVADRLTEALNECGPLAAKLVPA